MTHFYRELPKAGTAGAMRAAQAAVMKDKRFEHPFFWAAFNVVGLYR
jgi:CHAT domain-containing protein